LVFLDFSPVKLDSITLFILFRKTSNKHIHHNLFYSSFVFDFLHIVFGMKILVFFTVYPLAGKYSSNNM